MIEVYGAPLWVLVDPALESYVHRLVDLFDLKNVSMSHGVALSLRRRVTPSGCPTPGTYRMRQDKRSSYQSANFPWHHDVRSLLHHAGGRESSHPENPSKKHFAAADVYAIIAREFRNG